MLLLLALLIGAAGALDNGLGATPAMGYSTWNDCSSFRDNGINGWCWDAEDHVKNVTTYLINSGLAKLGYTQINVDEGWLLGRYANGTIYEDLSKFPSGMKGLGDWIKSQPVYPGAATKMRYGLYSCRGTCQCGTGTYSAPGSHGYEQADTDWMVAAGAQYLKIDSCCGDQDHAVAFSDYAKFRDAMNATGERVWFSLCGWEAWYSPPDPSLNYTGGASLGNSWRIAGDGSGWGPLTNCLNTQAAAAPYAGAGGWPDPDLLIGPEVYVGGQTDEQARAQFSMWALFPANLLISQNVLAWSSYALETYSNAELIAINQDSLASPAHRIVGSDLSFPCGTPSTGGLAQVIAVDCASPAPLSQQWTFDAASGTIAPKQYSAQNGVLDDQECASPDGSPVAIYPNDNGQGTCAGKNQHWQWSGTGTIINDFTQRCLDVYDFAGPAVDVWACNGGANQNFTLLPTGQITTATGAAGQAPKCLSVAAAEDVCTNVWGRRLSQGRYALGFVNNNGGATNITCDATCFAAFVDPAVTSLTVRDLWAHQDVAVLSAPFHFSAAVNGSGFAMIYKLTPN